MPQPSLCGDAAKRIEHGVAYERKHLHQARRQFERERRGMFFRGSAGEIPELLKPFIEFVLQNAS
jgi:hypothetical protein